MKEDWRAFNLDRPFGQRTKGPALAGLNTRILNCLRYSGFQTLGEAADHIAADPLWMVTTPNLGKKSERLLRDWLAAHRTPLSAKSSTTPLSGELRTRTGN